MSFDTWLHLKLEPHGWAVEAVLRLVMAAVAGGLVGMERQVRGREAGLRTYLLVCTGAAMAMIVSVSFAFGNWTARPGYNITVDPARIAYSVMAGIGFLGAGTIRHEKGLTVGLTTAAGLWCVTAVGLGIGFGLYTVGAAATALLLAALWLLSFVDDVLPRTFFRLITVRRPWVPESVNETLQRFKDAGVKIIDSRFHRSQDLQRVDIAVRIAFRSFPLFERLERDLAADPTLDLISVEPA
ncbi:MAG: magnesium transporter MgtC [Phycisphaerales bacterium]|jgi:putative Mg2+ transporter-C (MgtC) family protein|nr:magnesium transporter MgtC [Phycisphaerales bacterium]